MQITLSKSVLRAIRTIEVHRRKLNASSFEARNDYLYSLQMLDEAHRKISNSVIRTVKAATANVSRRGGK